MIFQIFIDNQSVLRRGVHVYHHIVKNPKSEVSWVFAYQLLQANKPGLETGIFFLHNSVWLW